MDSNPYTAPTSEIAHEIPDASRQRFYVISRLKFFVMFIGTCGFYEIYWTYKHWAQFKRATKGDQWPVIRSFFLIFVIHSLAKEIDHTLKVKRLQHAWSPGWAAAFVIIVLIASRILDRMTYSAFASPTIDILSFLILPALAYVLYRVQLAANIACDDPEGKTNSHFSAANFAWLGVGLLLWLISLASLAVIMNPALFSE